MVEERNQRSGNGNELLGADVNVVDLTLGHENKVAGLTSIDEVFRDGAFRRKLDVGLSDGVAILFPSREVEAERLKLGRALAILLEVLVELDAFAYFERIALAKTRLTGI